MTPDSGLNPSSEYPAKKRPRGRPRKHPDGLRETKFYDESGQPRKVYVREEKQREPQVSYEWEDEVKLHVMLPTSFGKFARQANLPKDAQYFFYWLWERLENGNSVPLPSLRQIGEQCAPEGTPYDPGRVSRIIDLLEERNVIVLHPMSSKTLRVNPKLCYQGKSPSQRASVKEYDKFRAIRARQRMKDVVVEAKRA